MTRLSLITRKRKERRQTMVLTWWNQVTTIVVWFVITMFMLVLKYDTDKPRIRYSSRKIDRYSILHRYVYESDTMSISQIRMTRACFTKLCNMLETLGGLTSNRNMDIDEQVAIFLHMIAHNVKNRVMICRFHRSGETISRCISRVCGAVIRLHSRLLKKPEPVPENSNDHRWKWFKNCLGALDGTYIKCLVPLEEKPRYRTRKGDIATNVLGVCSQDMQFIFVLPGWEGSAADGRVLRDALHRPNGLKVARPGYYLVDAGYTNGEGFLAPYRGQRYHLNDWRDGHQPTTPKELYNMKHSSARNVIERCFGILKARWGVLRDNSYYPIDLKNRIIMACCLLHNFIRQEMPIDPFETQDESDQGTDQGTEDLGEAEDNIHSIGTSNEWTEFRNNLAQIWSLSLLTLFFCANKLERRLQAVLSLRKGFRRSKGMTSANQGTTSANQDATSAYQGATSAYQGMPSANQGARSANQGARSAYQGATSAYQGMPSANHGATSAYHGMPSVNHGVTSANQGTTSANQGATSAYQGRTSANHGARSANQGATSAYQGATSANQGRTSANQGARSSNQGATSVNQGAASVNQSATSANQGRTSANQGRKSANQGRTYANRNYHGWTSSEDEKLIEALLHMVNTGAYKADNGFKSGYLQILETALKESLPNSGIMGKPHIESRIRTMKKDWQAVYDMLHSSGFGYDEENNCATTDAPDVWDSYIASHPRAEKLKDKKLANYPELSLIFGKDRAQGNKSKLVTEMEDEVNTEEYEQNSNDAFDEAMEASHNARTTMSGVEGISSVRSRKRKNMGSMASIAEVVSEAAILLGDRIKDSSAEMSEGIKLEVELKNKTNLITYELQKIESLTKVEKFRAIRKIKSEPDSVLTFWDLKEEEREEWVRFMLSE